MIYLKINDNGVIENFAITVSDSIKYQTVKFEFPVRWQGYNKTAVFKNGETLLNVVLDNSSDLCISEDECYIPYEVIKPPFFTVSVFGVLGDSRVTTSKAEIKVIPSGYAQGDIPSEPTPDEYAQILDLAKEAKEKAESVRKDLEEEIINGELQVKVVCDQTFKPESENAQSGKAVAQAVKNKLTSEEAEALTEGIPVIADTLNGISEAKVGQVITVGAVDDNGNVTRWDNVNYVSSSGGSSSGGDYVTEETEETQAVLDSYGEGSTRTSSAVWAPFILDEATHGHKAYKNKTITAIKLNAQKIGVLSIGRIKTVDYANGGEFNENNITERLELEINETGEQTITLPSPIVVTDDEDLFLGHSTDSAQIYYGSSTAKDKGFFYKTSGKNTFTNQPLALNVIIYATVKVQNQVAVTKNVSIYNGKKLSILGDSISTFSGYIPEGNDTWYPTQSITAVDKTWWKQVIDKLGMTLEVNDSWSGACVSYTRNSKTPAYADGRCKDLGSPDVIIVWVGINDFVYSSSTSGTQLGSYDGTSEIPAEETNLDFCKAYAIMLNKILTTYQNAEVWVCTLPTTDFAYVGTDSVFPKKNKNGNTVLEYNKAIKKIADAFSVNVIELDKCGITWQNLTTLTNDKLHPNVEGHLKIANRVVKTLDPHIRGIY